VVRSAWRRIDRRVPLANSRCMGTMTGSTLSAKFHVAPALTYLLEASLAQCLDGLGPRDNRKGRCHAERFDGCDDRRFRTLRKRRVLEIESERFLEIRPPHQSLATLSGRRGPNQWGHIYTPLLNVVALFVLMLGHTDRTSCTFPLRETFHPSSRWGRRNRNDPSGSAGSQTTRS
jgi:hypothetical protein